MGGLEFFIISILIILAQIWAIVDVLKSSREMVEKLLWILLVLFFPCIGVLIYYFAGRAR